MLFRSESIFEYDLSTAWDISTAVFLRSFLIGANIGLTDVFFKSDGLEMYAAVGSTEEIQQYTLSTAWNVTTATFTGLFDQNIAGLTGLSITSDGLVLKTVNDVAGDDLVREYSLLPAWDITTAALLGTFANLVAQSSGSTGIWFRDDKAKMYISDRGNDEVHEYDVIGLTADNVTVTGTGTLLTSEFIVGDDLCLGTESREIVTINTNTELIIISPFDSTYTNETVLKPATQPEIDCGATCSLTFFDNTVVTLTATPDSDALFAQWTGDIIGSTSPADVTLSGPRTVDAEFSSRFGAAPGIPVSSGFGACPAIPVSSGFAPCP